MVLDVPRKGNVDRNENSMGTVQREIDVPRKGNVDRNMAKSTY